MIKKSLFFVIAALALVASCAKEPDFQMPDSTRIPMNIDGSINQVPTKATAQGFVDKDAVGLFAVNYSENNTVAGTLLASGNQADNVQYVFDEPNQKWNPLKTVYYKDVNTHVDIYLYYPYQSSISDINASAFEVKKDQSAAATASALSGYEASDWLWGKVTDVTPSESKVRIPLSHKLSAVQVTLVQGTGFGEGEFESVAKSVILTSTTRKATLDFATGVATPLGAPQLDGIVMCPQESGAFRAIVVPQSVAAGDKLFAITLDGVSYSFTQPSTVTYQAGKQMNVDITINKKTPSGDYELKLGSTQITDWTEDRYAHGGDARQYYVVNVETPGTLGDVIAAAGKDPAKIRNLKVVGNINKDDFYFMRDQMAILEAINLKESVIKAASNELRDHVIPNDAFKNKNSLYFFVFPETVFIIGSSAFSKTNISGALIIPDGTEEIGASAFSECFLISSLTLPASIKKIGNWAFINDKYIGGSLIFPDSLLSIGDQAFYGCSGFTGPLVLPHNLEELGGTAFMNCSGFTGDLTIPDKITLLKGGVFYGCSGLRGHLNLNNVTSIKTDVFEAFANCRFQGELVIPEGVVELNSDGHYGLFEGNEFTSVVLPSSLKKIGPKIFLNCSKLMSINLPEGLLQIGDMAFQNCGQITELVLPSSLIQIGSTAFRYCYNITKIACLATQVPNTMSGAFDGVGKDNLTLEVPESAIARYQSSPVWSDFKRIGAYKDFSISRRLIRTLNGESSRTFFLRAPSGFNWSVQDKPDWVTVSPSSGIGKTEVTITVSEMLQSDVESFEVNEGTFVQPSYHNYPGRGGDVVFSLDGENYTTSITIEQYDYQYSDGYVKQYKSATVGNGIDIVIIGDGYDAKDIAKGDYISNTDEAVEHFFDVEPYKTYADYFNVYAVIAMSPEHGMGTVNTIVDNKFGSYFSESRLLPPDAESCFTWARKANADIDFTKSLVILLQNTSVYEGVTMMYGDGSALACCPVSRDLYPYDFRGIIQHEAGGHGFGKLADEYIYHNAFLQTCGCPCCDHGQVFNTMKSKGWYKNLSLKGDINTVPWSHLIFNPQFSNYVDVYEGGYMHSRGVFRSEVTSCMNNNIPYYSAISRQAIVERIMDYAGLPFSFEDFCAHDSRAFGTITKATANEVFDYTFGVDPNFTRGSEHGSIIYMGEHPDYSKIK